MIIKFNNKHLEEIYTNTFKGKPKYSQDVITKFKKIIIILKNVENSFELSKFKGLNFEALKGDKKGLYSVRVDINYRLEFKLLKDLIVLEEIVLIEELSKHYR